MAPEVARRLALLSSRLAAVLACRSSIRPACAGAEASRMAAAAANAAVPIWGEGEKVRYRLEREGWLRSFPFCNCGRC